MFQRVSRTQSFIEPSNVRKQELKKELLPGEISSRILDLEMECDKESISTDLIYQLVGEYTKAVEFYEEAGNQKYKQYQKRMHKFLQKPIVISLLRGQSGEMVLKKEKNQETIRRAENKADQEMKILLQRQEVRNKKNKKRIQQQINEQEKKLQVRMRTRINSTRTAKTKDHDKNEQNNVESGKKVQEKMNMKLLLDGVQERSDINAKKVYF